MYREKKPENKEPIKGKNIISKIINWKVFFVKIYGEGGIRTPEENFSLVFKTRAFDHSATSPNFLLIYHQDLFLFGEYRYRFIANKKKSWREKKKNLI